MSQYMFCGIENFCLRNNSTIANGTINRTNIHNYIYKDTLNESGRSLISLTQYFLIVMLKRRITLPIKLPKNKKTY